MRWLYNRTSLPEPGRRREEKGLYIGMLFVDTSESGSSGMLCFGLLLLQIRRDKTRFIREAVCKGGRAKKETMGCKRRREGIREKVPICRLIHEPAKSDQSALLTVTVTAKQAVDHPRVLKCGSIYWKSGSVCVESLRSLQAWRPKALVGRSDPSLVMPNALLDALMCLD